jgi:hypothetical protein
MEEMGMEVKGETRVWAVVDTSSNTIVVTAA